MKGIEVTNELEIISLDCPHPGSRLYDVNGMRVLWEVKTVI